MAMYQQQTSLRLWGAHSKEWTEKNCAMWSKAQWSLQVISFQILHVINAAQTKLLRPLWQPVRCFWVEAQQ